MGTRFLLLFIATIVCSNIFSQKKFFKIKGNLSETNNIVTIDVCNKLGLPKTYTATVKNNTFEIYIDKSYDCDTLATIRIGDCNEPQLLWLDNDSINITNIDKKLKITGTKLNDRYQIYKDTCDFYMETLEPFFSQFKDNHVQITRYTPIYYKALNYGKFKFEFIKENVNNPLGIYLAKKGLLVGDIPIYMYKKDSAIIEIFNCADERLKNDSNIIGMKNIAELAIKECNNPLYLENTNFPNIPVINTKDRGSQFNQIIKDIPAKYYIIDFWASWCGPCIKSFKNLREIYAKYNNKGLEIISISVDKDKYEWNKKISETNNPWTNVIIDNDKITMSVLYDLLRVHTLPYSLLIDKNGKIISILQLDKDNLNKSISSVI